jgi:hypothetical protein
MDSMAQAAQVQEAPQATLEPIEKPAASSPGDARRVNVVFSADQYNTLQRLASMQKISLSDALRQAISLSDLIVNANADPETKILLRKGDSLQELKIVR